MKDKEIAALLAFLGGGFGLHKFYLKQNFAGLVYLLFSWTGITVMLGIIESILFILSSNEKFDEKYNPRLCFKDQNLSPVEKIEKLATLVEKGYITQDEYKKRKDNILAE